MNPQTPDDSNFYSRVESYRATLTPNDQTKLASFAAELREALARTYGARLSAMVTDHIVDQFTVHDLTVTSTKSSFSQLPSSGSRTGWDGVARAFVENNDWAKANLVSSDRTLKAQLAEEFKTTLSPARLMTLARTGQFEAELAKFVKSEIEARQ